MKKRMLVILGCACMCLFAGCGLASHNDAADATPDLGEIHVASNMGTKNAFDGKGYYHLRFSNVVYIDAEHQADQMEEIYTVNNSQYLCYTMYHQGAPYILSSETKVTDGNATEVWSIQKWDPETKKLQTYAEEYEEDVMINSMAMNGSMLYYTTIIPRGEDIVIDGLGYSYCECQLWCVNTDTGEKKMLQSFTGSETQLGNALMITDGDYKDQKALCIRYAYKIRNDADEIQEFTDFYELDCKKQELTQMEDLQLNSFADMGYLYGNAFYYIGDGTDYNYMDMETGEVKTVLTSNMLGLLLQDYISFSTNGKDPRNYLYSYKDGTLLVSKKDVAHSPYIVGVGEQSVAVDETDYEKVTDYSEDPGVYKIADKTSFIQDNFTEYAGESADVLTFYGKEGKAVTEDATAEK